MLWIMLNPSTADATTDDPTIRRCTAFSKAWGYGGLTVVNLYAARTSCPARLRGLPDPVGPRNDAVLQALARRSGFVMVAWGAHPLATARASTVLPLLISPQCLGVTRDGHPRHPLYVRAGTLPTPYPGDPSAVRLVESLPT